MLCDNRICDICRARGDDCRCSPEEQLVVRMANIMVSSCEQSSHDFKSRPHSYKIELMLVAARAFLKRLQSDLRMNLDCSLVPTITGGFNQAPVTKELREQRHNIKVNPQEKKPKEPVQDQVTRVTEQIKRVIGTPIQAAPTKEQEQQLIQDFVDAGRSVTIPAGIGKHSNVIEGENHHDTVS